MTQIAIAIGLVLFLPASSAASWTLVPCDRTHAAEWQAYERTLRQAQPGSLHYLPKPFPKNAQEVIEDYVYQFGRLFETAAEVPSDLRLMYEGIQDNTLRFVILRLENWMPGRCGEREELAFYYLIRIFRERDGAELGRVTLNDSGFWAQMSPSTEKERSIPAKQRESLLSLADATARLNVDFGVVGTAPQYVMVVGWPRMCDYDAPCIAFRAGADAYLLSYRRELFRIPASAHRLSSERELKNPSFTAAIATLGLRPDEAVVSLGGPLHAVAQRIERKRNP